MNTHRMNITLPAGLVSRLRDKPNKSAFIAEAVREKLGEEDRFKERSALAEAYRNAAREERKLVEAWDRLASDGL